jgi:phosphofructokinase-like protein
MTSRRRPGWLGVLFGTAFGFLLGVVLIVALGGVVHTVNHTHTITHTVKAKAPVDPNAVSVPNLVGAELDDAENQLSDLGLEDETDGGGTFGVIDSSNWNVVAQDPHAVIRAVVRRGADTHGMEFFGFQYGWAGVLAGNGRPLDRDATAGILPRGGTILGTSRTNPYAQHDGEQRVIARMAELGIDALIPIGGEDTLGVARRLSNAGVNVVGVPKTIDNDLAGTDYTFGFQTAVQIATDAIDRLHTTAESHNRVMVLEVMGRHAGWIAVHAGLAGGADAILIPERPFDLEAVCEHLRRRHDRGRTFSIVVVSEGAVPAGETEALSTHEDTDAFGHARLGGIAVTLEREIEQRTGFETRMSILGHVQRGGTPTAYDRVLATRFGVAAADAVAAGAFGTMVALRGTRIERASLDEALGEPKLVDAEFYETAEVFFG